MVDTHKGAIKAPRTALFLTCLLATCMPYISMAQEAPSNDIIVTGSRLSASTIDSPASLQTISLLDIQSTGSINLQDIILENPTVGTPLYSRTNSNFDTQNAGVASIDLRNLGATRTLVLIDGRRVVSGVPGTPAVDLNMIPTGFINRVDLLTGGASSIYGSDAVAGVVNIITRKSIQGVEIDAQSGISSRGDGAEQRFGLTGGTGFADGRGNIMVHLGYTHQKGIRVSDRSTEAGRMDVDKTSLGYANGNDADLFSPLVSLSGFGPEGTYYTDQNAVGEGVTDQYTYDAQGNLISGASQFNRSPERYLAVPTTRYLAALKTSFEFSPAATLFLDATYARTKVRAETESFPFSTSYITDNGQLPIESLINGSIVRNAYVPDEIYANASDTDGDGLRDIYLTKRLNDFGNRVLNNRRDIFRIVAGSHGDIADGWRYEAYYDFGRTRQNQRGTGLFNSQALLNSLSSVVDVDDLNGNGDHTEIICVDKVARAEGCIPANIFGRNSLAPASSYIGAPQSLKATITQHVAHGEITGTLPRLGFGAGPISLAAGIEYRAEKSIADFDALSEAGLNGGNMLPDISGKYNVKEAFAEIIAPVFADKPLLQDLTLRGAIRISDYSTSGTVLSYNYGGQWKPTDGLRFRATRARSVRAPSIAELYSPQQQGYPSNLADPCVGITTDTSGSLADRCRANPGVNANILANGAFTQTPADRGDITSYAGGTPTLRPEKGDSFSAGIVIAPESGILRGMSLSVDYFDIKIKDAIVTTPLQFILNQCYETGNDDFCGLITRRNAAQGSLSAGSLARVDGGYSNSGGVRTSGIDVTFGYAASLAPLGIDGSTRITATYTRLTRGYSIPLPGEEKDEFAGEIGASKDRFRISAGIDVGSVGFTFTGTYIGAAYLDDQLTGYTAGSAPEGQPQSSYRVSPQFYGDVQLRFKADQRFDFYVGADNLFDNKPPFLADLASTVGVQTDSGTYDALGRRFYAGARLRF